MLTDSECKNASCPSDKKRKRFTDAGGLYLEVSPAGSKRWFWKTYADGKEGRMALGSYPDVPLKAARQARDAAKLQKYEGTNPVEARKLEKLKTTRTGGDTFRAANRLLNGAKATLNDHCGNWSATSFRGLVTGP